MYNSFFIDNLFVTCFAMTLVEGAPSSRAMSGVLIIETKKQSWRGDLSIIKQTCLCL